MINTLNRGLDIALHVDSNATLNDGTVAQTSDGQVAADIKRALTMLKAEAYDEATAKFAYAKIRASETYGALRECTGRLNRFDLASLAAREERLAFWINLYNALIIDAVISFGVRDRVTRDSGFFRRAAYRVGMMRFSADDIEHGILRVNRRHPVLPFPQFARGDPRLKFSIQPMDVRIHAALNCAARSCPSILIYDAEHLDAQLNQAMCGFVNASVEIDTARRVVRVSPIFRWYAEDFGRRDGIIEQIGRELNDETLRAWLWDWRGRVRIEYIHYDWSLNE